MVEALLIYLTSIIVCIGINRSTYLSVLKRIVDDGKYVIKQPFDGVYKELFGVTVPELLIPFYNVLRSVYQSLKAVSNMDFVYQSLEKSKMFENIEFEKQRKYQENPNVFNAKKLIREHEREIRESSAIVFNDHSVIVFDAFDQSMNKIKRTVGPISEEDIYHKFDRLNHAIELYYAYVEVCYEDAYHDKMPEEIEKEMKSLQFVFDLSKVNDRISVEEFKELSLKILHCQEDEYNDENAKNIRRIRRR